MKTIVPSNESLRYMGRIDDDNCDRPVWIFPYTQVSFRFTGTTLSVNLFNRCFEGESHIGFVLDGYQGKVHIPVDDEEIVIPIMTGLPNIEHEVTLFKREDGKHYVEFLGVQVDDDATIAPPRDAPPTRRMEVFGASVASGDRNEATLYAGQADPDMDLSSYSNSWYSYPAIAARNLHAQLHDIAQSGIALLDGTGWFHGPDYIGMEHVWDRLEYNPDCGASKPWNFDHYTPHVVLVTLGQNDGHPDDCMALDYFGAQAKHWRTAYGDFVQGIRRKYPHTLIVLATHILQHDPAWDRAIGEVCESLHDPKIAQLIYTNNAVGTPGHPRIAEHQQMASELTSFIEGFGNEVWED